MCANDDARIAITLPHWIRVFGERLDEIVIAVDEQPRTGRMADAEHVVVAGRRELDATLGALTSSHPDLVRVVRFDATAESSAINRKWFRRGDPIRCQSGSPIFGYLLAIESTSNDFVLKVDCDMLFHERGWLDAARTSLERDEVDFVDAWRVGRVAEPDFPVSTRAFALHRSLVARRLPIEARKLDPVRRLHRRLLGRPPWHALERSLGYAVQTGRMRATTLPRELGFSLHVPSRTDFAIPGFEREVVAAVEAGVLPDAQWDAGSSFERAAWAGLD